MVVWGTVVCIFAIPSGKGLYKFDLMHNSKKLIFKVMEDESI